MFSLPADELERLDGLFARIEELGRSCKDKKEFISRYVRKPLYQEKFRMWGDFIGLGYLHPWATKMINDDWKEELAAVGRGEPSADPPRVILPPAAPAVASAPPATIHAKRRTRVCKQKQN